MMGWNPISLVPDFRKREEGVGCRGQGTWENSLVTLGTLVLLSLRCREVEGASCPSQFGKRAEGTLGFQPGVAKCRWVRRGALWGTVCAEPQSSGGHGAAWPSLVLSVLGDLAHPCQQGPGAQGDSNSWTSFWNSSRCSWM